MYNQFKELLNKAASLDPINVAIINPIDDVSLGGALEASINNLINPILIGDKDSIKKCAIENNLNIDKYQIIHCTSEEEILQQMVYLAQNNMISAIMKGKIHTDHLMSAIVKKDNNLRTSSHISHIFALVMPSYDKILYVTDCAINIAPSLEQKEKILLNAISLFKSLHGNAIPKIGVLSATETTNIKMISSTDAETLAQNPNLSNKAIIEGPLAFDVVISKHASYIKNISSKISGEVDILLMPNIESGNILFKSLVYLANAENAGIVLGAKIPIILTSRADSQESRLLSTVLARLYMGSKNEQN